MRSLSNPLSAGGLSSHPMRRVLLLGGALLLLALAVLLMPSPPARTAQTTPSARLTLPERPSLITPGYVLVLVLLGGGGVLALYLRRKALGPAATPALLQTLGQLSLAPGQQLRLVACGHDVLLLGITAGQISVLRHYSRSPGTTASPVRPTPSATPPDPVAPPLHGPSFADVLQHYHRTPPTPSPAPSVPVNG